MDFGCLASPLAAELDWIAFSLVIWIVGYFLVRSRQMNGLDYCLMLCSAVGRVQTSPGPVGDGHCDDDGDAEEHVLG